MSRLFAASLRPRSLRLASRPLLLFQILRRLEILFKILIRRVSLPASSFSIRQLGRRLRFFPQRLLGLLGAILCDLLARLLDVELGPPRDVFGDVVFIHVYAVPRHEPHRRRRHAVVGGGGGGTNSDPRATD